MNAPWLDYSVKLRNLPIYRVRARVSRILDYRDCKVGERKRRVAHWVRVIGSGG